MRRSAFLLAILQFCAVGDISAQPPPARVVVTPAIEKEVAPTTALLGSVDFDTRAGISAEVSGVIAQQFISEGTLVKKGAVLLRLNTDFLRKDRDLIAKEIAQLEVRIANTRKNLKRLETLFQQNVTTEKDYEDLSDQLKKLATQREARQVSLAKKELELAKSEIRAPFDGLVLARLKNEGEWIAPGVSLCELAAVEEVVARVAVPEDLVRHVQVDQLLTLSLSALGKNLSGKVRTVVPKVDLKSRTFDVKVAITYEKGLLQNMTIMLNVPSGTRRKLTLVPRDALVRMQGREFVYTVKEGQAKIVPIAIAAMEGNFIGVDSPLLTPGMPVVIDGNERLQPDQAVQVVGKTGGAPEASLGVPLKP